MIREGEGRYMSWKKRTQSAKLWIGEMIREGEENWKKRKYSLTVKYMTII